MKIQYDNNNNTWKVDLENYNKYNGNVYGFHLQPSIVNKFLVKGNKLDDSTKKILFDKIANMVIGDIVKLTTCKILKSIDIRSLPDNTKQGLQKAVYAEVQYRISNNKVLLDADNRSLRFSGYEMSSNSNEPALSVDRIGFDCKKEIDNSGIKDYELRRIEGYQLLGTYYIDKYGNYKEVK